jgi:hypothetical protein
MFKNEDEKWRQFRDLTEIMENAEKKRPSDNFTSEVMARLSEKEETSGLLNLRRLFPTIMNFSFGDSVTRTECAFYFFLTGFFYLVLGFILMLGLRLPAVLINSGWLSFQPAFGLILAAELALMGIAVYKDGDISIRFVRAGTLLYAALILINGFMGAFFVRLPMAAFFNVIFSITGLATAFLLGLAVNRYYPKTISQEVRG